MALSFQIDVTKYAAPGETKTLLVQERDKGGRLLGQELVTVSRPQGIPDIVSSGSGYIHEIPISERAYNALKSLGEFQFFEYQPAPDPVILPPTLSTTDPWQYMTDIGMGLAKYLSRPVAVKIAQQYGYMGN